MLTARPGSSVTAVAVGRKDRGSIVGATDFSVSAFVPKKLTETELRDAGIQSFSSLYADVVGAPPTTVKDVDVVETGSPFEPIVGLVIPAPQHGRYGGNPPTLDAQKPFASLRVGIGVTNPVNAYPAMLSVGTIGFYMRDDNDNPYLVSNNHVIGRSNNAQPGEAVVQPGTLDLTTTELQLMPTLAILQATLQVAEMTAVVQINFMTPSNIPVNTVDVALARLTNSSRSTSELHRLTYGGSIRAVAAPYTLDPTTGALQGSAMVYKVGRTTGYTEGIVTNVAGTAVLSYNGNSAYYANQIIVQDTSDNGGPFSNRGDSGSGVLNDRHELVGLLFAGSAGHTLVNPIDEVLQGLKAAAGIPNLTVITA